MTKFFKYILITLFSLVLYSCFSEKFEFVGNKKITNKEDWKVKFYQQDKFEMFTPVRYEIVNENDSLIAPRHSLLGTDANLQNVDDYYTKVNDSIFFICYPYPKIMAIKHISKIRGSNQWDLIKRLRKYDSSLYIHPAHIGTGIVTDSLNSKPDSVRK